MRINEITSADRADSNDAWRSYLGFSSPPPKGKKFNYDATAFGGGRPIPPGLDEKDVKLITYYVTRDEPPTGATGKALEKLISVSKPINRRIVSYRGIRLDVETAKEIIRIIDSGEDAVWDFGNVASFTSSDQTAWDFAKDKGHRAKSPRSPGKTIATLLEVIIPAGTKVGRLKIAFGLGHEHIVSKNHKIVFHAYKKYREGFKLMGVLE